MKSILMAAATCFLAACAHTSVERSTSQVDAPRLQGILAAQTEEHKARHAARNPYETLSFFGISPGMTVVEALPGDGWYSRVLVPYLGGKGKLIGLDYPTTLWATFPFGNAEFIEKRKQWPAEWVGKSQAWMGDDGAQTEAYAFNDVPASLNGTVDAVLFFRALHGLARAESQGQFLTQSLQRTLELLKPGGVVGIVQHEASEQKSDEWANGSNGYLKRSYVKNLMQQIGFEFIGESDINTNPKDLPEDGDVVWRLPPSLAGSQDNPELRQKYQAIGESNRMTLVFRKPLK